MITIIAAMDPNRVIGIDDKLPWDLPEDLSHFKKTTLGHPILMGRKTYESLPFKPLPKRTNIVISSTLLQEDVDPKVKIFPSLAEGLEYAQSLDDEVFVIGGQKIYEAAMDIADRLVMTQVSAAYPGNYFFPVIDSNVWIVKSIIAHTDEFTIVDYHRLATDS